MSMGFQVDVLSYEFIFTIGVILALYLYCHFPRQKKKALLANDSFARPPLPEGESSKWRRNCRLLDLYGAKEVRTIEDKFSNVSDVSLALRKAGLDNANLIFGIDFTVSNLHQGEKSFNGRCLHDPNSNGNNPYQQVIQVLGETLEPFDEDGEIPAFGFGDKTTKDHSVFPLDPSGHSKGFRDVLASYNRILENVHLSGPTNFAPLIYRSLEIVRSTKKYHILVIVADGQVTSERDTKRAIVDASYWPLSIVMIGVGDGPWDVMEEFDNTMEGRKFDNFQFVDFQAVMSRGARNPQAAFALQSLMEIPDQFMSIRRLGLMHMNEG